MLVPLLLHWACAIDAQRVKDETTIRNVIKRGIKFEFVVELVFLFMISLSAVEVKVIEDSAKLAHTILDKRSYKPFGSFLLVEVAMLKLNTHESREVGTRLKSSRRRETGENGDRCAALYSWRALLSTICLLQSRGIV